MGGGGSDIHRVSEVELERLRALNFALCRENYEVLYDFTFVASNLYYRTLNEVFEKVTG